VSATHIGEPDLGLLTQTEVVERARCICRSVDIPIIVDADTGYGNALNVVRTVRALIDAGAAGCFLEDTQGGSRVETVQPAERNKNPAALASAAQNRSRCTVMEWVGPGPD